MFYEKMLSKISNKRKASKDLEQSD